MSGVGLDAMVSRLLAISPFEYRLAADDAERAAAYRLRAQAALEHGWRTEAELPGGEERDEYDDRAMQLVGWDGDVPICTGRVVLPPGLPTEEACGLVVEPVGGVADVGRMCVASTHRSLEHAAFVGLMCALYAQVRASGYDVACGMMSPQARSLVRMLGLDIELLGPERTHWNEPRAPVRFSLLSAAAAESPDPGSG